MGTRSKRKVSIELEMNESWSSVPISSIANSAIGGTPSRGEPQYWGGTTPWATAKDVASVSGRYLHQVEEFITDKGLKSSTAKLMPEGTVVITARGTVGALAQLGQEMAFNQTCYAIVPSDELDNNFLFYALKGTLAEMRALTYGSVFETITKRSFDNWRIPCPQLPVQRSIAHILGTLDDKIELNRQINQTLEEMAHAIYKDWFVDFGPTRAKLEGREPYLPPDLWELFPDCLVDSELGMIPEEWHMKSLRDVMTAKNLKVGEIDVAEYSSTNTGLHPRSEYFKKQLSKSGTNNKLIHCGDLVFGLSRRILNFGLMRDTIGCVSAAYRVFTIDDKIISPEMAEQMIRTHSDYYYGAVAGSSREGQSISPDALGLLSILCPPITLQEAFYTELGPAARRKKVLEEEATYLTTQRDVLLPKLLSGELRIGY